MSTPNPSRTWKNVYPRQKEHPLWWHVSDLRLELSLRYDTEHGRLSLGIMLLRIFSLHTYNNDMGIVSDIFTQCLVVNTCLGAIITMFLLCRYLRESDTVWGEQSHQGQEDPAPELCRGVTLQWKVQHQAALELSWQRLLCCQPLLQVQKRIWEKIESLDLLVNRNKFGVKAMMGRTNVGPFAFATGQPKVWLNFTSIFLHFSPFAGQGLEHWQEMSQRPGLEVVKWHKMVTNNSWPRSRGKQVCSWH